MKRAPEKGINKKPARAAGRGNRLIFKLILKGPMWSCTLFAGRLYRAEFKINRAYLWA